MGWFDQLGLESIPLFAPYCGRVAKLVEGSNNWSNKQTWNFTISLEIWDTYHWEQLVLSDIKQKNGGASGATKQIMGMEPRVHGGHLRLSGYKVLHIPHIWRIRYWDDDPHLGWFWCQPCPSCQPIHCSLDIRGGQRSNDSGVGKWIRKSIRTCNTCINVIYIYISW